MVAKDVLLTKQSPAGVAMRQTSYNCMSRSDKCLITRNPAGSLGDAITTQMPPVWYRGHQNVR
jgi:hypothetical protein